MPRRRVSFVSGFYYHIFNRVVDGESLFNVPSEYLHFLKLTKSYSSKYSANIVSYCLMPNHYHFLVKQLSDIPVSTFISVLLSSYVQKVNRMRGRIGALFSGRFKSILVEKEEYLVHLCRYIHLNPVAAGLVKDPEEWEYSNYLEWIGKRRGELVDRDFLETHFSSPEEYQAFVMDHSISSMETINQYLLD